MKNLGKKALKRILALRKNDLTQGSTLKNILYLAFPLMVSSVLNTTQSLIDMFWVGRLGSGAIAAVALAGTVIMVVTSLIVGISTGTMSLVSQNIGARRQKDADTVAMQSIIISLVASFLLAIVGFFYAENLLSLMGAEKEVVSSGAEYLRILFLGGVTMFILFLGNAALQGAGDMIVPMMVVVLANILNMILDPIFIFGIGMPAMGVAGAAWATVISQAISCFIILYILCKGHSHVHIRLSEISIKPKIIIETLKIGLPSALQFFFRTATGVVLMGIVASFGTYALAAYGIGMRLQMVTLMPAFAFGAAAATMVGQNLGAGKIKQAQNSAFIATSLDLCLMLVLGVIFFVFAEGIVSIFDKTKEVVLIGKTYFRITSIFYSFVAFGVVLNRALGGAGDTFVPMIITFLSLWVIQIPLAIMLSRYAILGLTGVWWAIVAAWITNSILMLLWFFTGRWKKGRITNYSEYIN